MEKYFLISLLIITACTKTNVAPGPVLHVDKTAGLTGSYVGLSYIYSEKLGPPPNYIVIKDTTSKIDTYVVSKVNDTTFDIRGLKFACKESNVYITTVGSVYDHFTIILSPERDSIFLKEEFHLNVPTSGYHYTTTVFTGKKQ